jgi:flagellar biosynthesis protein FlhF
MRIKRFEAKNMTTALRMIKDELGPEAVILSARSLRKGKGFFGSLKYAGVEVSAAIDNEMPRAKKPRGLTAKDPYRRSNMGRVDGTNSAVGRGQFTKSGYPATDQRPKSGYRKRKKPVSRSGNSALSSLYQQILLQEVDRGIASELIEEVKRIPAAEDLLANGDIKSHLSAILEDMGVMVDQNAIVSAKQTIMAFIGTTGVGKTTTVAKLAALQTNQSKKSVGLITVDNYSIVAMQQLSTYARIIGVPLLKAVNAGELKKAVKEFKDKDIILIDTPGINPQDPEQIQELKTSLSKTTGVQTQLVLSATTKEKDCIAISEALKEIGVHSILFTKTDESSVFGNIVNVLIRTSMPLSFLCGGRHVPDDIEAATVPRLIDLLFRSNRTGGYDPYRTAERKTEIDLKKENQTDEQPYFVANKNSDVFHCTACKWAKKIKPGNIIHFADAHLAEAQNFLPCRSCNPDRDQGVNRSYSKIEMKQYSNYR